VLQCHAVALGLVTDGPPSRRRRSYDKLVLPGRGQRHRPKASSVAQGGPRPRSCTRGACRDCATNAAYHSVHG
jgi:hypothetical protein